MKLPAALLLFCQCVLAQGLAQRGTLEFRGFAFPDRTSADRAHILGEAFFRYEVDGAILPGLRLSGATETRIDTRHQTERRFYVNWTDRNLQRPAFSIRRLSLSYTRQRWTVELGKQAIHWGRTEILNPTDRFSPRDYINLLDLGTGQDVLAVTAARAIYETPHDSFEAILQPLFTPSRTPLLNQRWTFLPAQQRPIAINDAPSIIDRGHRIPGGSQYGMRWNHTGPRYEWSLSFFDGRNHLPLLDRTRTSTAAIELRRQYPRIRTYGTDAAVPLPWFKVKGEATMFTAPERDADEYLLYVVQLERAWGPVSVAAGYAGEWIRTLRAPAQFAPDRGLARSFVGRAGYTIGKRHSVGLRYAIRPGGDATWLRSEYSHALDSTWRVIGSYTLFDGTRSTFLGEYRRNSHFGLIVRAEF